jgi:hypothetical protein
MIRDRTTTTEMKSLRALIVREQCRLNAGACYALLDARMAGSAA